MSLVLHTGVIRQLPRDELEHYLDERLVSYGEDDSDDELRDMLFEHEASGQ